MKAKPCPCCGRPDPIVSQLDTLICGVLCPDFSGGCGLRMIRDIEIGLRRWRMPADTDWVKLATDEALAAWNRRETNTTQP